MPVKMQPTSVIKAHLGINPDGRIQRFFTNTCYKAMDEFVPMDNGDLRTVVTIGTDTITYEMPYAEYQYYGMRKDGSHVVKNYTTPGSGTYWDKRMWTAKGQDVVKQVQNEINRRG